MADKDFLKDVEFKFTDPSAFPPEAKALVEEAADIRGWCVQSFAQVEFILAYLVHRASKTFPEYAHLSLPYRPDNRPKRVRVLLAIDGPLKVHAEEVDEILMLFLDFEDFRHLIVHGWSDVLKAPNGYFLRYRRYQPSSDRPYGIRIVTTRIETLREQHDQLISFSAMVVRYFAKLFHQHGLEDGDDDDAFPPPSSDGAADDRR